MDEIKVGLVHDGIHRIFYVIIPIFILFLIYVYSIHFVIAIIFSHIMHEFGHYIFLRKYNTDVKSIHITLLSCYLIFNDRNLKSHQDLIVSLMGPIMGIVSIIFIYPYMNFFLENQIITTLVCIIVLFENLFNLIPIEGYDGYYVLKSIQT